MIDISNNLLLAILSALLSAIVSILITRYYTKKTIQNDESIAERSGAFRKSKLEIGVFWF